MGDLRHAYYYVRSITIRDYKSARLFSGAFSDLGASLGPGSVRALPQSCASAPTSHQVPARITCVLRARLSPRRPRVVTGE